MSEKTTLGKFATLLIEQLGAHPEECVPDARLAEDLAADSLDIVELEMAVEEEFDIKFADTASAQFKTVRDWVTHIDLEILPQPQ